MVRKGRGLSGVWLRRVSSGWVARNRLSAGGREGLISGTGSLGVRNGGSRGGTSVGLRVGVLLSRCSHDLRLTVICQLVRRRRRVGLSVTHI